MGEDRSNAVRVVVTSCLIRVCFAGRQQVRAGRNGLSQNGEPTMNVSKNFFCPLLIFLFQ